jgi:enterobactin synthetase component D
VQHCSITVGAGEHDWRRSFGIELPGELHNAVPKRWRDYLAGRYCARVALGRLDPALAAQRVETGSNREPIWPRGVVGSITHTEGFAAAAVALESQVGGVGLDAERILNPERAREIERLVLLDAERPHAASAGLTQHELVSLAFSAKEAVFKCLYAFGKELWDFTEVALTAIDTRRNSFAVEAASERVRSVWPGEPLACHYALMGDYVHTGCVLLRG